MFVERATALPIALREPVRREAGQQLGVPRIRWLRAAEVVHGSALHPLAVVVDAVTVVVVGLAMPGNSHLPLVLALVPIGALFGLYHRRSSLQSQGMVWYVRTLAAPTLVTAGVIWTLTPAVHGSGLALLGVGAAAFALVLVRTVLWLAIASARRRGLGLRFALVSGPAAAVDQVARRVPTFPECGLQVVAAHVPHEGADHRDPVSEGLPPDGRNPKRALDLIDQRLVDHVLIVAAGGEAGVYDELVHRGEGSGIDYSLVVPLAGFSGQLFRHRIGELGILPLGRVNYSTRRMPGKRVFDVVGAGILLMALSPLLLACAVAVKAHDGGPVLFRQPRVGRDRRVFRMWKFRSMVVDAEERLAAYRDANVSTGLLFKMRDDPRITGVGALMRRLSLDELPQLVNVLKGEMSLVGPRPLPVDPDQFDEVAAKRHSVRPGVTGPWQVHGANALTYDDMVDLDLAYISGWSFRGDLWYLLRTIPALFVRRAPI